jgi:rubrerythrin
MDFKIPEDLKVMFDHVVNTKFKGDEEEAVLAAVVAFLEKEKASLMDQEKFRLTVEKTLDLYRKREERAETEFDDAFARMARKKSKAAERFDALTRGEDEPEEE